ncbi:MAG: hypothetical protein F6K17_33330 [Okeania sp. SIO3C4]|nr:hypothetical protein [Okeania sp. SIO3B3]NER07116.1 hypothetical protein [Okeania sp. SIO3C4]
MKIFLYYPLKRGGFKPQFFGKVEIKMGCAPHTPSSNIEIYRRYTSGCIEGINIKLH